MDDLLRLLELVRRELGAEDAYVRLGGQDGDDPRLLAHALRSGCCLVVRMAEPPARPEVAAARLAELAEAFTGTVDHAVESLEGVMGRPTVGPVLTQTLADLRDATGAAVALVIDRQSPVIWGCSDPALGLRDRPAARALAAALASTTGLGTTRSERDPNEPEPESSAQSSARRALMAAERMQTGGAAKLAATIRTLMVLDDAFDAAARLPQGDEPGLASKGFGGLYRVVLVFTRPFSPLRVEGVLRRALPIVERQVLELPPLDPEPKGGRVVPLR
ncbi:hypothetical protein [Paraliomyxa miuraensis]|uniref:hypothetical protein n=1 Tax=Paraliomyxa miuraensis TaxID=376150 RepID=UPI002250B14F|nr:hypothetical protein [Paraliomyxa miuraensis]MCX4245109.1 hypothetical protein [Paraliomyxa miuraensis]